MPYYDYHCTSCTNEFEIRLPIEEFELPTKEPCRECGLYSVVQTPCAPALGDAIRMGVKKPPADFQKYVLGRMKASIPNNIIGKGRFGPLSREI